MCDVLEYAAMVKVAGSIGKSTEVMKIVNNLIKVPELAKVMQEMSRGEEGLLLHIASRSWPVKLLALLLQEVHGWPTLPS